MKTIKIMSDGNQAKVGMICAYVENDDPLRIEIGVITNIKNGFTPKHRNPIELHDVIFQPINATYNWGYPYHFASLRCLSKATPEQKKSYWLELEKQTIQFRPEFEAKLKELDIRDQFVNNFIAGINSLPKRERIEKCNNTINWHHFINYAFFWESTPERGTYWANIAQK